jgi:hypothetical protein
MATRPPPPLWFVLLVGVLEALAWRWLVTSFDVADPRILDDGRPALAFWPIVLLVVGWIWTGIQVAGRITLQVLAYSVKILWAFATRIQSALVAVGRVLVDVGKQAWRFLRWTYTDVLKPAWQQFWKWFDQLRKWLDKTFGPVLRFLDAVRTHILKFYDKWVRPILDVIGFARQVLGILASLGLEWARELDRKLRWLEEKIDAPFRLVLAKLNEIVNVVNRVVTADGLFQRLAYIRSLERDMRYVGRAFVNWRSSPLTAADFDQLRSQVNERTEAQMRHDFAAHVSGQGGPRRAVITEMGMILRNRLER